MVFALILSSMTVGAERLCFPYPGLPRGRNIQASKGKGRAKAFPPSQTTKSAAAPKIPGCPRPSAN